MTPFSRILAALNLLGAAVAISLLVTTFFAEGFLVRKARQFALDKTRMYLDGAIPAAEKLLIHPLVGAKLPASVKVKLEDEIAVLAWGLVRAAARHHSAVRQHLDRLPK